MPLIGSKRWRRNGASHEASDFGNILFRVTSILSPSHIQTQTKRTNLSRRKNRIKHKKQHRCKQIAITPQDSRTFVNVCINGNLTRLQLDTGADITMISRKTWKSIGSPKLDQITVPVKTADGSPMNILGHFDADFIIYDRHRKPTYGRGSCYVTRSTILLGLEWCSKMTDYRQLKERYYCNKTTVDIETRRNDIISHLKTKFSNVFQSGLGLYTRRKAKLFLRPDARPVYRQKRPVPFASQAAVDAEIDRLLKEDDRVVPTSRSTRNRTQPPTAETSAPQVKHPPMPDTHPDTNPSKTPPQMATEYHTKPPNQMSSPTSVMDKRPQRQRRTSDHLQINPSKKSYSRHRP
ncbi:hypothetical protein GCK32_000148 [Trichostrongylus colubriformis]|uniref:Peptidase A2 domain-containing protein n=1 Tax=Trichostrongylus colubriformis TaxID=6319 RepID=A0AAN8FJQ1_TRICO